MPQYNTKDEVEKSKNIYRNMYRDTTKRFSASRHLLSLWKASCFKLIWHDFMIFVILYASLSALYRHIFYHDPKARQIFEIICVYAERFSGMIPITFLTGFYVSQVVNRWWDQFMSLPWPDRLALKLVCYCPGTDDFNKNLRRTVMRYVNLSTILVYRLVSEKVHDRFPDYNALVEAKLMLPNEIQRLEKADARTPHESTWTPILWALKLITKARQQDKIQLEAPVFANLQSGFDSIEAANRKILNYGWVNFPLAYVQVATVSVFLYFTAALFGRQYLIPSDKGMDREMFPNLTIPFSSTIPFKDHTPDFFIPFFTLAEFFCYMGWIKVAETLLNPFGDDDEDFQINYLIDRNLQVSYMIVDDADRDIEMAADPFLEAGIDIPKELPYRNLKRSRTRVISQMQDPGDNLSTAGSVASFARGASSTMTAINKLNQFRKKFGSRQNLHVHNHHRGQDQSAPQNISNVQGSSVVFGGSMPPNMKPDTRPQSDRMNGMMTIPGSNSDLDESEGGSAGDNSTMPNDIIFENPEQLTYFDNSAFMTTEVESVVHPRLQPTNKDVREADSAYRMNLPDN